MTEDLKKLIECSPHKSTGYFRELMFVSNGIYDGMWGVNGYDYILILGYDIESNDWCIITDCADKFDIFNLENVHFNLDIPSDYGVPRIWFRKPIYINDMLQLSNVVGEIKEE